MRRHGHEGAFDSEHMVELLEVEGRLSVGLLHEAMGLAIPWLDPTLRGPRRVIDLGCGPGIGTVALADRFPTSTIVGVDASEQMLDRAAENAARFGDRIETRRLDLEGDLAVLGHADLVVAAMSIHHVADEATTLRQICSIVEPTGVMCLLERAAPTSVRLSDDLGRPDIWDRLDGAWFRWFETTRSHLSGASNTERYPQLLDVAGFEVVEDRSLTAVVATPDDAPAQRVAARELQRTAWELDGWADPDDLAAIRRYLEQISPTTHDRLDQIAIRLSRRVFVARPASAHDPHRGRARSER